MSGYALREAHVVASEAALRDLFPPVHDLAQRKSLTRLERHSRSFIERAPFLCLGTQAEDGTADVSPRGDSPGFVHVLDDQTLLIPDRPGNNRLDSLSNIIGNPSVGLLFLIPGIDETMRVNGTARLTCDPDLLALCAVEERLPRVAIVVDIAEVFIHCAKAFRRSGLWDPEQFQDRRSMPSLPQIIHEQTSGIAVDPQEMAQAEADLEVAYAKSMY